MASRPADDGSYADAERCWRCRQPAGPLSCVRIKHFQGSLCLVHAGAEANAALHDAGRNSRPGRGSSGHGQAAVAVDSRPTASTAVALTYSAFPSPAPYALPGVCQHLFRQLDQGAVSTIRHGGSGRRVTSAVHEQQQAQNEHIFKSQV